MTTTAVKGKALRRAMINDPQKLYRIEPFAPRPPKVPEIRINFKYGVVPPPSMSLVPPRKPDKVSASAVSDTHSNKEPSTKKKKVKNTKAEKVVQQYKTDAGIIKEMILRGDFRRKPKPPPVTEEDIEHQKFMRYSSKANSYFFD